MNNPTKYIEDAINSGSPRVKIVVNGLVTEADSKTALVELRKPKNARNGYWSLAEPFVAGLHGEVITEPTIVDDALEVQEELEIEEVVSKKKKKTSDQSNES